ncbi:unnamed protein product [Gongylonema pulchrum]|uniref:Kringle domain-containing protein n=1 Tax=Gongylonema pulchrum TaxID=637853 RepID=A0A183DVK3_9BILA|nr:unnamed protein product [Gongylonema pulchrum]
MRKTLKRRRPPATNMFPSSTDLSRCVCKQTHAHLLRDVDNKLNDDRWQRKEQKSGLLSNFLNTSVSAKNGSRNEHYTGCTVPQMNCFVHGADHWRTPPFWPELYGQFCFCQNSNNNTYWCLRTVNSTHNFLYCEFITEFISYYDLNADPYQLHNSIWNVPLGVLEQLSEQLQLLRTCRGYAQCEHYSSSTWYVPFEGRDNSIS